MQEGILALLVGALNRFLEFDGVNDRGSSGYVNHFHDGVIERVKGREEIQIPSHENEQIELVGFDRYTCRVVLNPNKKCQTRKGVRTKVTDTNFIYSSSCHKPLLGLFLSSQERRKRTLSIFGYSESQQQYNDAEQVRHVAAKPKDIHIVAMLFECCIPFDK